MARPQRNNVDYFPFFCEDGKKMYYLEETYGNDGFAVFLKILRELAKTDYHYLDLSKKTTLMFLSAKCKVQVNVLESIINDLVELEKFDVELWKENKIIWCQDFIDSIQDAYSKRSNKCIDRIGLIALLISLGVRKPSKVNRKPPKKKPKAPVNPQSKVEESKEEESKAYKAFDHLSISTEENDKLVKLGYSQNEIDNIYDKIQNFKKNTNYNSLYLTAINWLKREYPNRKPIDEKEKLYNYHAEGYGMRYKRTEKDLKRDEIACQGKITKLTEIKQ